MQCTTGTVYLDKFQTVFLWGTVRDWMCGTVQTKLIVIDSISARLSHDLGDFSRRARALSAVSDQLLALTTKYPSVAVSSYLCCLLNSLPCRTGAVPADSDQQLALAMKHPSVAVSCSLAPFQEFCACRRTAAAL